MLFLLLFNFLQPKLNKPKIVIIICGPFFDVDVSICIDVANTAICSVVVFLQLSVIDQTAATDVRDANIVVW